MAITFKTAVNRVLVKLREDEVSSLAGATDYQKLIAAFVNEAKEEVSNSYLWSGLYDKEEIATVAETSTYSLTGWGDEFSVQSVFNASNNVWMRGPMNNWKLNQWEEVSGQSGTPLFWDLYQTDASGDAQIRFWPTPGSVFNINVYGYHHQAYLDTDTDDNTLINVPWKPVVFGAYAKAVSERGEDGGQTYDECYRDYENAISDAVALEAQKGHDVADWHNNDLNFRSNNYIGLP